MKFSINIIELCVKTSIKCFLIRFMIFIVVLFNNSILISSAINNNNNNNQKQEKLALDSNFDDNFIKEYALVDSINSSKLLISNSNKMQSIKYDNNSLSLNYDLNFSSSSSSSSSSSLANSLINGLLFNQSQLQAPPLEQKAKLQSFQQQTGMAVMVTSGGALAVNHQSSSSSSQQQEVPFYTILISIIMYSLIFLIGFFGNALVIIVAFLNRTHQHNTHYCLVNLSIADLLLIIVCMPSAILDLFSKEVWYLGKLFCKIIPWLEHTVAHASILTIVSISIERSLAIALPLRAKQFFTSERLWIVVILIWVISTLSSIPIMIATSFKQGFHRNLNTYVNICVVGTGEKWQIVYLYISLFLFYLIPCISLFVLYGNIVFIIKNRNKKKPLVSYHSADSNQIASMSLMKENGNVLNNRNNLSEIYYNYNETSLIKKNSNKHNNNNSINRNNSNTTNNNDEPLLSCNNNNISNKLKRESEISEKIELSSGDDGGSSSRQGSHKETNDMTNNEINQKLGARQNYPSSKSSINSIKFQKNSIKLPQINQKQIILLLIVMMFLIFICLLPYRVFSLWVATATKSQLYQLGMVNYYNIITFCRVAFYTNSALNPIFYHIISTKFQTAFKKFFKLSYSSSVGMSSRAMKRINNLSNAQESQYKSVRINQI